MDEVVDAVRARGREAEVVAADLADLDVDPPPRQRYWSANRSTSWSTTPA